MAEAIAFYRDVMGLEPVGKTSERNAFFRCGEGILLLFNAEETLKAQTAGALPVPPHGASGPGHVCFAAEGIEIDAWRIHLEGHGVQIESDFLWPNGARSIYSAILPTIRWKLRNLNFGVKACPRKVGTGFRIRACVLENWPPKSGYRFSDKGMRFKELAPKNGYGLAVHKIGRASSRERL